MEKSLSISYDYVMMSIKDDHTP